MATYFDEHDCQPLAQGERPNHMLHLARLLLDTGLAQPTDWENLFPHGKPPPSSEKFIESLEKFHPTPLDLKLQCPVCLGTYNEKDELTKLPCRHHFHCSCLLPWLKQTSTCPLCRHDLPTDDKQYEEYKVFKKREAQRVADLEILHDSMFS